MMRTKPCISTTAALTRLEQNQRKSKCKTHLLQLNETQKVINPEDMHGFNKVIGVKEKSCLKIQTNAK